MGPLSVTAELGFEEGGVAGEDGFSVSSFFDSTVGAAVAVSIVAGAAVLLSATAGFVGGAAALGRLPPYAEGRLT